MNAEQDTYEEVYKKASDLYSQRRFKEAILLWQGLREKHAEDPLVEYCIASVHSMLGNTELALEALDSSVNKGFTNVLLMREDPDIEEVRESVRYKAIEKKAREKFLGSIKYTIQEPESYDPHNKYKLLIHMPGAGSDGSDWNPVWRQLKTRKNVEDLFIITCEYITDDAQGLFGEGYFARNALTLLAEMAQDRWSLQKDKTIVSGFSAGGAVVLSVVLSHPHVYPHAIIIEGGSRKPLDKLLLKKAKAAGLQVAIVCGDRPGLFLAASKVIFEQFKAEGVSCKFFNYPQERVHKVDPAIVVQTIETVLQWLWAE